MCVLRHISDEQRGRFSEFTRPAEGSQKMANFFVAPPRSRVFYTFVVAPKNYLIFWLLSPTLVRILYPRIVKNIASNLDKVKRM